MNRRGFLSQFRALALIPAAVSMKPDGIPKVEELENPSVPGYNFKYRGYHIRWSGWKAQFNYELLNGQWLAAPVGWNPSSDAAYQKSPFVYSDTGGMVCRYGVGYCFDVTTKNTFVNWKTPESEREALKTLALKRLTNFIDREG